MKDKKIRLALTTLLLLWMQFIFVHAADEFEVEINAQKQMVFPVQVMLDGQVIPMAVPPYATASRIVVPVRFLAEHVGAVVKWDNATQRVIIITLKKEIELWVGKDRMRVNGEEIPLDKGSIPQLTTFANGEIRTMVPLRAISEALGYNVSYDADTRTGVLTLKPETELSPNKSDNPPVQAGAGDRVEKAEVMISNGKLVLNLQGISHKKVKVSKLEQPNRVIFDIEDVIFNPGKWEFLPISYDNIDKIRIAQFQGSEDGKSPITRVVFDVFEIKGIEELRYFFEDGSLRIDIRAIEDMKKGTWNVADKISEKTPGQSQGPIIKEPGDNPTEPGEVDWMEMAQKRLSNMRLLPFPDVAGSFEKNKLIHILIDPGHGGRDPGTISSNNKKEKDFALPASLKLRDELQKMGYIVHMTRETDWYPTLMERANQANSLKVDIFISMHANSVENKSGVNGIEVYYSGGSKLAGYSGLEKKLATTIKKLLIDTTGAVDRGVKTARHVVTINSKMAAILIESGFISNPMEERLLYDENYQNVLVRAISVGVNDFVENNRQTLASSKNTMIAAEPSAPVIPPNSKRVRYKVNADALNVRQSPGLDHPSLGKVYEGEILTVEYGVEEIQKDGYTWLYTTDNSGHLSGWLAKEFLIEQ